MANVDTDQVLKDAATEKYPKTGWRMINFSHYNTNNMPLENVFSDWNALLKTAAQHGEAFSQIVDLPLFQLILINTSRDLIFWGKKGDSGVSIVRCRVTPGGVFQDWYQIKLVGDLHSLARIVAYGVETLMEVHLGDNKSLETKGYKIKPFVPLEQTTSSPDAHRFARTYNLAHRPKPTKTGTTRHTSGTSSILRSLAQYPRRASAPSPSSIFSEPARRRGTSASYAASVASSGIADGYGSSSLNAQKKQAAIRKIRVRLGEDVDIVLRDSLQPKRPIRGTSLAEPEDVLRWRRDLLQALAQLVYYEGMNHPRTLNDELAQAVEDRNMDSYDGVGETSVIAEDVKNVIKKLKERGLEVEKVDVEMEEIREDEEECV